MSDYTVDIWGMKELERKLMSFSGRVAKNLLNSAVRAGANEMKKEARSRAPVRTGQLKKSITVRKSRGKHYGESLYKVGFTRGLGAKYSGRHAHLIEFGHMAKDGSHVPAYPFFRPAFDTAYPKMINAIRKKLRQRIEREALKG